MEANSIDNTGGNPSLKFKAAILDYMGKYDNGIMVKVSITVDSDYFEGIFFYNENQCLITVEEELETNYFGGPIEDWEDYVPLMQYLINHVVPWTEMINNIDPIESRLSRED